jgi:hypothetical protein
MNKIYVSPQNLRSQKLQFRRKHPVFCKPTRFGSVEHSNRFASYVTTGKFQVRTHSFVFVFFLMILIVSVSTDRKVYDRKVCVNESVQQILLKCMWTVRCRNNVSVARVFVSLSMSLAMPIIEYFDGGLEESSKF